MQEKTTPEQQVVHYAVKFIDARQAHIDAPQSQKDKARDEKHAQERELKKAVRNLPSEKLKKRES